MLYLESVMCRGAKRSCVSKEDHVVYIRVLETLQGLLKNEAILSEVQILGYITM